MSGTEHLVMVAGDIGHRGAGAGMANEVLRQIKADARTQAIPVVVLTASREERDVVESYKLGVNSYIVKPVDFDQLKAQLQSLLPAPL